MASSSNPTRSASSLNSESSQAGLAAKRPFSTRRDLIQKYPDYLKNILETAGLTCTSRSTIGQTRVHCLVAPFVEDGGDQFDEVKAAAAYTNVFNEIKFKLDKDELGKLHVGLLTRCINNEKSTDARYMFNFTVVLGHGKECSVCRTCFEAAYGMSTYQIDKTSSFLKAHRDSAGGTTLDAAARKFNPCAPSSFTYSETKRHMGENVLTSSDSSQTLSSTVVCEDQVQAAKVPNGIRTQSTVAWMRAYVKQETDKDPEESVYYGPHDKKCDVYDLYAKQWIVAKKPSTFGHAVTRDFFNKLWASLFPHLELRDSANQCGTCPICMLICQGRKAGGGDNQLKKCFQTAHAIHRPYYMGERQAYHDRVEHALQNPEEILSLAIDIMESREMQYPNGGTQYSFTHQTKSVYVGALVHGIGLMLYRTNNNVHKSADLTVHVLLCEIQKFLERNEGKRPELIYVQFDGGSENANQTVLAVLELLVILRVSRCIVYSRLPSTHSHDDGDGAFGNVKEAIKGRPMPTYDCLPKLMKEVFANWLKLQVEVTEVHMVNAWTIFMAPHIDKTLSNLHKMIGTQHQWMFTGVEISVWYPLGVLSEYRTFSQDMTFEALLVDKEHAKSPLGQSTGIDFYQVNVTWFPDKTPSEGVLSADFRAFRQSPFTGLAPYRNG